MSASISDNEEVQPSAQPPRTSPSSSSNNTTTTIYKGPSGPGIIMTISGLIIICDFLEQYGKATNGLLPTQSLDWRVIFGGVARNSPICGALFILGASSSLVYYLAKQCERKP